MAMNRLIPWHLAQTNGGKWKVTSMALAGQDDWSIMSVPLRSLALAHWMIRAVNLHDRLASALRELSWLCENAKAEYPEQVAMERWDKAEATARALLAELEGA